MIISLCGSDCSKNLTNEEQSVGAFPGIYNIADTFSLTVDGGPEST